MIFSIGLNRRNTRTMRSNVPRAIGLIKEKADDIVSTSGFSKSNNMSLIVSETNTLLDGMKLLCKSSDYGEQVRFLTLSSHR